MEQAIVTFVDHWQSLAAGLLGAAAAIVAVIFTLGSEARRREQEASSLRVALGAEIRQFALRAYEAHLGVRKRLEAGEKILAHHLEDDARFPAPVIYQNTSNRLGALGRHAHDVVVFFGRVDLLTDAIRRLKGILPPDGEVDQPTAATLIDTMLAVCQAAVDVQPAFNGTPRTEHDAAFARVVSQATDIWNGKRTHYFGTQPFEPFAWGAPQDLNRR